VAAALYLTDLGLTDLGLTDLGPIGLYRTRLGEAELA